MSAVPGFKQALKEYESDKVKDRVSGGERLREILGNRETLAAFQEWAAKDSGAGWTRLFEGLYSVVALEKKAVMKRNSTAQAEKRLSEAISLVRWMAERSVHLLPRRPLLALVRHMTGYLVQGSALFPPAVRDYAKALRTVLSYPPHLENIEEYDWKKLMSVCWAGALGDRIVHEEQWNDEGHDELEETQDGDDDMLGTPSYTGKPKPAVGITQGVIELLNLVPVLLSSPSAPLLPPSPPVYPRGTEAVRAPLPASVGCSILVKVTRFLEQHPSETSGHLPVLRSCNIVLVELELNARDEIVKAGAKLLPLLVGLWSTRNKPLREQLLIALRLLLPWLSHETVEGSTKEAVREGFSRLADSMGKESASRWGIEPLDLQFLRIAPERVSDQAFSLGCLQPGFDFSHEMAFAWTVQKLYADVIIYLYTSAQTATEESPEVAATANGRSSKRRRVDNQLSTLLNGITSGSPAHHLLSLQILTFILCHHHSAVRLPDQALIRSTVLDCMEADDENLQSWAYICLSFIQSGIGVGAEAGRVWASSTRRVALPATSRAAAFCATTLFRAGAIGTDIIPRDVGNLLRQIDIQGPPHPYDSVCSFLSAILELAQSDVRLYSQNLEDKVLAWLARHDLVDGPRGRTRMDARAGGDVLRLLCTAGGLPMPLADAEVHDDGSLPECPIVERVLEEQRVQRVRLFVLRGEFPASESRTASAPPISGLARDIAGASGSTIQSEPVATDHFPSHRQSQITAWLRAQMKRDLADWQSQSTTQASKSSERVRKSLDLAVLSTQYQATLQSSGISTDAESLSLIHQLLLSFRSELESATHIRTQLFLWQAFQPILPAPGKDRHIWPIASRAGRFSGIRADLSPVKTDEEVVDERSTKQEDVLVATWRLPEITEALRELILVARKLTDDSAITSVPSNGANVATQRPTQFVAHDDDDFGEIRIAETDAMPVSKEALDSQRSTMLFLRTVISFRLSGARFLSQSLAPPRDSNLLNAFLSSEGVRMIQLGRVICEAVTHQQLRLTLEAIELTVDTLEEVLSSYAYSRDEGFHLLVLSFLRSSASIWLADELKNSEIAERAMVIAQHVVKKAASGHAKSWRVRLDMLLLLDEYCDFQPGLQLWGTYAEAVEGEEKFMPTDAIIMLLKDLDIRVRVKAATSHAETLYLDGMPPADHQEYYVNALDHQPKDYDAFNFFLTHALWRLNLCIVSGHARPAALYHLYEIPSYTPSYNIPLRRGFEAVAERLGLASVQVLWLEHVEQIGLALIGSGCPTLNLPPSLGGYSTDQARAQSELPYIAPALVAGSVKPGAKTEKRDLTRLSELCEAAGITATEQILRSLYPTAARILADIIAEDEDEKKDKKLVADLLERLSHIPTGGLWKAKDVLSKGSAAVAVHLLDLVAEDGRAGAELAVEVVKGMNGADADLLAMVPAETALQMTYSVEGRVGACYVVRALRSLAVVFPFDRSTACYNSLLHLFGRLDTICSSAEQLRLLYQVALTIAVFADTLADGRILQLLILEAMSLLNRSDIQLMAFSLVKWGFSKIPGSDGGLTRMSDIIARLGRVRQEANSEMVGKLDSWVQAESARWQKSDLISTSIDQAAILWPEDMRVHLGILPDATFEDVADLIGGGVPSDSMSICGKVAELLSAGDTAANKRIFVEQSFWRIKDAFSSATWTAQGAQAFVASLAEVDGQIDAPEHREDKVVRDIRAKLAKEPQSLPRVLVIRHLLQVIDKGDRTARVGAYLVLRRLRTTMQGLIDRTVLPRAILSEVELLQSPYPSELKIPPRFSLDSLRDDILTSVDKPDVWLREMSIRLCDIAAPGQPFFAQLRSFLLSPTTDVAPLLPLLVQACLSVPSHEEKTHSRPRRAAIEAVFQASLHNPAVSDAVIHAILNTVLHLRHYIPSYRKDMLGYNHWLKLDFMLLSESAVKVGSFATALLFLEIAKRDDGDEGDQPVDLSDVRLQKIMMAVYSNVNDPDGFYGVKINNVKESLRLRLNHEGEHMRAFGLHGADLEAASYGSGSTSELLASARDLHSIGIHRTALAITQSVRTRTDQVPIADDLLFEIAWRTGDWDLPVPPASAPTSSGAFYSALRSLHRSRDQEGVQQAVNVAMKAEMLRLKDMGSERMTDIQKAVDNLLSLREVSLWLGPDVQRALAEGDYKSKDLRRFSEIGSSSRYPLAERLHATKMSILTAAQSAESRNLIGDMTSPLSEALRNLQIKAHLGFSGYARVVGKVQASINAITAVQRIEGATMSAATADEYGEVLWTQNEHSLALQLAEGLKEELDGKKRGAKGRVGVLAGRIAYWSYRARLLPVMEVHDMFREAHLALSTSRTSEEELAQLSHDYATFAAEQQAIKRQDPTLTTLREYRDRRRKDLADLVEEEKQAQAQAGTSTPKPTATKGKGKGRVSAASAQAAEKSSKDNRSSEARHALQIEWQDLIDGDTAAIHTAESSIDTLTTLSLKMFAHALRYSDKFDDSIMKMCSIWLAHCYVKEGTQKEEERATKVANSFTTTLHDIPSHKFIPLAAQLAARLYQPEQFNAFNDQLNKTVLRVSQDHPYHCLHQIIPLAHGYQHRSKNAAPIDEGRCGAAGRVLRQLEADKEHPLAMAACRGMSKFSDLAIPFCLDPAPDKRYNGPGTKVEISKNLGIRNLRDKLDIPIATAMPPVDTSKRYDNIPKLVRYDTQYTLFGGVHRPKRVAAYDDAGGKHLQLFKGEDDIRQDAVMEQVFGITNKMLSEDRQTTTRKLRFRTYAVIPLAQKTGIIEFVADGQSLGEWLKPAHDKYRGGLDTPTTAFRNELMSMQQKLAREPEKIKAKWEEMTAKFRPVMRHYFTEKHKDPMGWFAMRLRYSRSVAVTSMVGWVLGIGDRHLSNIMIDSKNGELIHIDFGHVFESGRALHVPERVPFRLTNDMIDGLGLTGIEGTFRRCSEQTIRVLRTNSDLILTILEVFKHDPLYAWETPNEQFQRLHMGPAAVELNKSAVVLEKADRVLAMTRDKLDEALSVEYTVNMVVQEARNPEFLATIFHGWQAWY